MLILILIILIFIIANKKEHYADITPYKYHWDIFSCYDIDCIKQKGYNCYKWCNNLDRLGEREHCKIRCLDYSDMAREQLRLNQRNFGSLFGKFDSYSILNNTDILPSEPVLNKFKRVQI